MSGMFSSPKIARPEAPPPSPVLAEEAQRKRMAVAAGAAADLAAGGRRSTEFAGREAAMTEQMAKAKKRRSMAGDELLA